MPERSKPANDDGRVVRFRPRGVAPHRWRWPLSGAGGDGPVDDLARFERTEGDDDYRHRMTMNALGLLVTVLLVAAGIWIVSTIAEMRKNQDCYLSGRRNCTPIVVPPMQRD